jgi:hypothetical protein
MAETMGMVNTRGRGLFRGWWRPVDSKLVSDQTAAAVPEIMDGFLY